jgi:hypothetical protein
MQMSYCDFLTGSEIFRDNHVIDRENLCLSVQLDSKRCRIFCSAFLYHVQRSCNLSYDEQSSKLFDTICAKSDSKNRVVWPENLCSRPFSR